MTTEFRLEDFIDYYVDYVATTVSEDNPNRSTTSIYTLTDPLTDQKFHPGFYTSVALKREFRYPYPKRKEKRVYNEFLPHQKFMAKYLSPYTNYDRILAFHGVGTGKTMLYAAVSELAHQIKPSLKRTVVLVKNKELIDAAINDLSSNLEKYQYTLTSEKEQELQDYLIGEGKGALAGDRNKFREYKRGYVRKETRKLINQAYVFMTYDMFAKEIKGRRDHKQEEQLLRDYSNCYIIVDEAHNLKAKEKTSSEEVEEQPKTKRVVGPTTGIDTYEQIYWLFHNADNIKVMLLTGTPMQDQATEIAGLLNLLLPDDETKKPDEDTKKLTADQVKTVTDILDITKASTLTSKQKTMILGNFGNKLKGIISYVRPMESVEMIEQGSVIKIGGNRPLIPRRKFQEVKMSDFQTKAYVKAYVGEEGQSKFSWNSDVEASMFVYPDGTYGYSKTLNDYMKLETTGDIVTSVKITGELYNQIRLTNPVDANSLDLQKLEKFSAKFAFVLRQILENKGQKIYCYIKQVRGGGALLLSGLLQMMGYERATGGNVVDEKPRFMILTSETMREGSKDFISLMERFNDKANDQGQLIQVVIGSQKVSEGVSYKSIRKTFMLSPWWNRAELDQALGRSVRSFSHDRLPTEDQKLDVYFLVSMPNQEVFKQELKRVKSQEQFKELVDVQEELNVIVEQEADYAEKQGAYIEAMVTSTMPPQLDEGKQPSKRAKTTKKKPIETSVVEADDETVVEATEVPSMKSLDAKYGFSVDFYMYYVAEQKDKAIKAIEQLMKVHAVDCALNRYRNVLPASFNNTRECDYSQCDYVCVEPSRTYYVDTQLPPNHKLPLIEDTYNLYFADETIQEIKEYITSLFQVKSGFNFFELYQRLKSLVSNTLYLNQVLVIRALYQLIYNNVPIMNRYGFVNYLRYDRDMFFLVDDPLSGHLYTSMYYSDHPLPVIGDKEDPLPDYLQEEATEAFLQGGRIYELLINHRNNPEILKSIIRNFNDTKHVGKLLQDCFLYTNPTIRPFLPKNLVMDRLFSELATSLMNIFGPFFHLITVDEQLYAVDNFDPEGQVIKPLPKVCRIDDTLKNRLDDCWATDNAQVNQAFFKIQEKKQETIVSLSDNPYNVFLNRVGNNLKLKNLSTVPPMILNPETKTYVKDFRKLREGRECKNQTKPELLKYFYRIYYGLSQQPVDQRPVPPAVNLNAPADDPSDELTSLTEYQRAVNKVRSNQWFNLFIYKQYVISQIDTWFQKNSLGNPIDALSAMVGGMTGFSGRSLGKNLKQEQVLTGYEQLSKDKDWLQELGAFAYYDTFFEALLKVTEDSKLYEAVRTLLTSSNYAELIVFVDAKKKLFKLSVGPLQLENEDEVFDRFLKRLINVQDLTKLLATNIANEATRNIIKSLQVVIVNSQPVPKLCKYLTGWLEANNLVADLPSKEKTAKVPKTTGAKAKAVDEGSTASKPKKK